MEIVKTTVTATLVGTVVNDNSDQLFWRLSEPVAYRSATLYGEPAATHHVVTSAATVLGCEETYVFAANGDGEISDWCELPGSFRGALDHAAALRGFLAAFDGSGDW